METSLNSLNESGKRVAGVAESLTSSTGCETSRLCNFCSPQARSRQRRWARMSARSEHAGSALCSLLLREGGGGKGIFWTCSVNAGM